MMMLPRGEVLGRGDEEGWGAPGSQMIRCVAHGVLGRPAGPTLLPVNRHSLSWGGEQHPANARALKVASAFEVPPGGKLSAI